MIEKQKASLCQLVVIINFGKGSKVLSTMKDCGITSGTILMCKGSNYNKMLDLFGLNDIRKEMIFSICNTQLAEKAMQSINEKFSLKKKNTGLAFTIPVYQLIGVENTEYINEDTSMISEFYAIYTVVDMGNANEVIEIANSAGAKGATIIEGRGGSSAEISHVFAIDIEPEKEIVLIVANKNDLQSIVEAIRKGMQIDKEAKGIIYVQPVSHIYGVSN